MSFQFPSEIKDLVRGLHDDTKWQILELLISNNNKVSYTQIKNGLGVDESKGPLNYHLKELQKSGWVRNWVDNTSELADNQKSFYAISDFGLKAIEGIMKAMDVGEYQHDQSLQLENIIGLAPATSGSYDLIFTTRGGSVNGVVDLQDAGSRAVTAFVSVASAVDFLNRTMDYGTSPIITKRRERRRMI